MANLLKEFMIMVLAIPMKLVLLLSLGALVFIVLVRLIFIGELRLVDESERAAVGTHLPVSTFREVAVKVNSPSHMPIDPISVGHLKLEAFI